ncbi:MAG: hypothetical protein ABI787_06900 [Spartobacteria bacterium]
MLQERVPKAAEVLDVDCVLRQQIASERILERGEIILEYAPQPHHLNPMDANLVPALHTKGPQHKSSGKDEHHDNPGDRAQE